MMNYRTEYKYNSKGRYFTEDGHTMFNSTVLTRLERLAYVEMLIKKIGGTNALQKLAKEKANTEQTESKDSDVSEISDFQRGTE